MSDFPFGVKDRLMNENLAFALCTLYGVVASFPWLSCVWTAFQRCHQHKLILTFHMSLAHFNFCHVLVDVQEDEV